MRAMKLELNSISVIDLDSSSVNAELKAMQQAVGGHIETVRLKDGGIMIVDEEGLLKQYPRNDLASIICGHHVYGTALIVGVDGEEFDDVPQQYLPLLGLEK